MIYIKRVYVPAAPEDGKRFLVDRLWPRGVRKEALALDAWLKDAAPSNELRRTFHHDVELWEDFKRAYFAELDAQPEAWQPLRLAAAQGPVTLLFAARDELHNNAAALKEYMEMKVNFADCALCE